MKSCPMWDDRFLEVCRRHPDVIAVYESRHGRLGLLLRQTLVPLGAERVTWLTETRATVRAFNADVRGAGFAGGTVVLQWLPAPDVARIVARWVRRWDGDPPRRSAIIASVERAVADQTYVNDRAESQVTTVIPPTSSSVRVPRALDETGLAALKAWYEMMAPCWLAIQPARRRRLVLQTHVWIAERVLADPTKDPGPTLADLAPDGPLAGALTRLVPDAEREAWRTWIELVRTDLERALLHPRARRSQAWARWLFLIPYSVPVSRRGRPRAVSGAFQVPRPA
ncbi:MAG TPA: hypothetical protein VFW70_19885 [Methylomirabilota bacterium]|nr:hypothetical protein [Methylomirabilota bacterium]